MNIDRVTITGADDSVHVEQLVALSERYPFVEWGILLSQSAMGIKYRFPSMNWLNHLSRNMVPMQLSGHICGRWVQDMLAGTGYSLKLDLSHVLHCFQRLQWNFHAEHHLVRQEMMPDVLHSLKQQHIFQMDGVNENLLTAMRLQGINVVPLFDLSGGAGIVPAEWPPAINGLYCGYAGGLGPMNLEYELGRIAKAAGDATIWIDMERRVRSQADRRFDLLKVEACLRIAEHWVRR